MANTLLSSIQNAIAGATFDAYKFNTGFSDLLNNQLGVKEFKLTNVQAPTQTSSLGDQKSGVIVNGTLSQGLLGASLATPLNPAAAKQNVQLFFWEDAGVQCAAFFLLDTDKWTLGQSFEVIKNSKPDYFDHIIASNKPLVALSTSNLWKVNCKTITGDAYPTSVWVHNNINVFFSATPDSEFTQIPQYNTIRSFVTGFTALKKLQTSFDFSAVIDNKDADFPIITLKASVASLKEALSQLGLKEDAVNLGFGLGTSKIEPVQEEDVTPPAYLATNVLFYLNFTMSGGSSVPEIQFQDLVSVMDMSLLNVSLTAGQIIPLSDLATVFKSIGSDHLTGQSPPTFKGSITSDLEILDFGFSLAMKSASLLNFHLKLGITALPTGLSSLIPGITFNANKEDPILLYWNIDDPFGTPQWDTSLTGSLTFLKGDIDYQAQYISGPDKTLTLSGGLQKGSSVQLGDIEDKFHLEAKKLSFFPDKITAFAFSVKHDYNAAAGKKDTFSCNLSLDNDHIAPGRTGISGATINVSNDKYDLAVGFLLGGEYAGLTGSYVKADLPKIKVAHWKINGSVELGNLEIDLAMDTSDGEDTITGNLNDATGKSVISDIIQLFNPELDLSSFPANLDISEIDFKYHPKSAKPTGGPPASFGLGITDKGYGKFVIAGVQETPKKLWYIGVELDKTIDFSKLPLVGNFIKDHGGLSIAPVQLNVIPQPISAEKTGYFEIPEGYPGLPDATEDLPKEAVITATVNVIGEDHTFTLKTGDSLTKKKETPEEGVLLAEEDNGGESTEDGVNQPIGKSFGPVTVQKFSAGYASGHIDINVTASLSLGGVTLALEGVGIGVPFPFDNNTNFEFKLHGLGVAVNEGPLKVAGGFLDIGDHNYVGEVNIQAAEFGLQAYGGYENNGPEPSFFIFVNANFPIGGPPFFFVDGVSGGLGINRAFKLPTTFKELKDYPLLPGGGNNPIPTVDGLAGKPTAAMDSMSTALSALGEYIYPEQGNYWVAAGLDVNSFEMVQVDAVMSVSFGVGLDIGLLGSANMTLPIAEGDPDPLAYIAINFVVALDVEKGTFSAIGALTPASYIYSGLAHISGGFAFDIWFAGKNEGDYIVSIGGYNPHFKKPAHYPSVPRLDMVWGLGPFALEGKAYFAMTPKLMMAGLEINAHWHGGPVKAWFNAGVDFLLGWKPFFYEADAYIHMAGKVDLLFTVTIHAGANLTIWGPAFGGSAHFDLSIISFTIHFGADRTPPGPLKWPAFKELIPNSYPNKEASNQLTMLAIPGVSAAPAPKWSVTTIQPNKGLLKQHSGVPISLSSATITGVEKLKKGPPPKKGEKRKKGTWYPIPKSDQHALETNTIYNWVMDPNHFQFNVTGNVPLTQYVFNTALYKTPGAESLGIAPMNIPAGKLVSQLSVELMKINADNSLVLVDERFRVTQVTKAVTGAMWSGDGSKVGNINAAPTIPDILAGIQIMPPIWHPQQTKFINIYELVFQQNLLSGQLSKRPTAAKSSFNGKHDPAYESADELTIKVTAFNDLTKSSEPSGLIGCLHSDFPHLAISVSTKALASIGYEAEPLLSTLGANTDNTPN